MEEICTHTKHASHPKPLHLPEAPERLFRDVLNERVQCAFEERRGCGADLRVNADEIHQCLVYIWSDF